MVAAAPFFVALLALAAGLAFSTLTGLAAAFDAAAFGALAAGAAFSALALAGALAALLALAAGAAALTGSSSRVRLPRVPAISIVLRKGGRPDWKTQRTAKGAIKSGSLQRMPRGGGGTGGGREISVLGPTNQFHHRAHLGGVGMATFCLVTGVPSHALLGDLEDVLLPVCMQRILAIEVQEHNALIEFESEVDAEACVGETRLLDSTVQVDRHDSSSITPSRMPPAYRRTKAESKAERERRLNRVGLSYRCGRCGQPKKGHVCTVPDGDDSPGMLADSPAADGGCPLVTPEPAAAPSSAAAARRGEPGWDLGSDAIFKDMKSVLTKSGGKEGAQRGSGGGASGRGGGSAGKPPLPETTRKSARKAEAESKVNGFAAW